MLFYSHTLPYCNLCKQVECEKFHQLSSVLVLMIVLSEHTHKYKGSSGSKRKQPVYQHTAPSTSMIIMIIIIVTAVTNRDPSVTHHTLSVYTYCRVPCLMLSCIWGWWSSSTQTTTRDRPQITSRKIFKIGDPSIMTSSSLDNHSKGVVHQLRQLGSTQQGALHKLRHARCQYAHFNSNWRIYTSPHN